MDLYIFSEKLNQGLVAMEFDPLPPEKMEKLFKYHQLLMRWNKKINLTAHREEEASLEKNFLDSLALSSQLSNPLKVMDIGSGAGFPGLVLKICHPQKKITLVESDKRKCAFLAAVIRELSLTDIRVENIFLDLMIIQENSFQGTFDSIVSRATISLREILPIAFEILKSGGRLFVMLAKEKISEKALQEMKLRFNLEKEIPYHLPFSKLDRKIVIFQKRP